MLSPVLWKSLLFLSTPIPHVWISCGLHHKSLYPPRTLSRSPVSPPKHLVSSLRPQPGADGSDWTDRRSKYPFLSVCLMIWLTSPEPLRFTHFFAVKKGKWELIWNKLLFFFTLLTGNPLRNTERVPDQCFRGQLSPEHVNVWSAALGEQH